MFNLFLDRDSVRHSSLNNPLAETVKRQFSYIEKTLQDYYARSAFRLENSHILIQVLRNLSYDDDRSLEDVITAVTARGPYVARHYGFTSSISVGQAHKRTFYAGKNSEDYILDHRFVDIDPFSPTSDWRDIAPIKVLYHPAFDLNFILPSGHTQPYQNNFSVVMLDVVLLSLQYHLWKREQRYQHGDDAVINPNIFLIHEVLPKMYRSHFTCVLMNNVFLPDGFHTREMARSIPMTPVTMPDISNRVKVLTQELHRVADNRRQTFERTLTSLPLPYGQNALQALKLPRIQNTIQVRWLLWLSRFRYMFELIRLTGDRGLHLNRAHIATLKRELSFFLSEGSLSRVKNPDLKDEFLYFAGYVDNL